MKYEWGLLVVVMLQLRIIPVRVLQTLSMNPLPCSQLCSTCSSRSAYSAYLDFFSLHPFLCIWEISKNNRPGGKRETIVRRGKDHKQTSTDRAPLFQHETKPFLEDGNDGLDRIYHDCKIKGKSFFFSRSLANFSTLHSISWMDVTMFGLPWSFRYRQCCLDYFNALSKILTFLPGTMGSIFP